jgi:hypothetical protein
VTHKVVVVRVGLVDGVVVNLSGSLFFDDFKGVIKVIHIFSVVESTTGFILSRKFSNDVFRR